MAGCAGELVVDDMGDDGGGDLADSSTEAPSENGKDQVGERQQALSAIGSSGCNRLQPLTGGLWSVEVDGQRRKFWVQIPFKYRRWRPEPTPVVLSYHGFENFPLLQKALTKLPGKAEEEGFIAVFPRGTGDPLSWNGGGCCGDAEENDVDDVAFTNALLDKLESKLCVDKRRVFASGYSNGGYLTQRLACELSDRIAAFGTVAGQLAFPACNPARPIPIMHFHGTADETVPFEGRPQDDVLSVDDTMAFWSSVGQCAGGPSVVYDNGDATCEQYSGCAAGVEVELCVIDGGGHTWPGGLGGPLVEAVAGKVSNDVNATDRLWDFFLRHPLP